MNGNFIARTHNAEQISLECEQNNIFIIKKDILRENIFEQIIKEKIIAVLLAYVLGKKMSQYYTAYG